MFSERASDKFPKSIEKTLAALLIDSVQDFPKDNLEDFLRESLVEFLKRFWKIFLESTRINCQKKKTIDFQKQALWKFFEESVDGGGLSARMQKFSRNAFRGILGDIGGCYL